MHCGRLHHRGLRYRHPGRGHHAPHAPSRPAHHARLCPARRPGHRKPGRRDRPLMKSFDFLGPAAGSSHDRRGAGRTARSENTPRPASRRRPAIRVACAPGGTGLAHHHLTVCGPAEIVDAFAAARAARGSSRGDWILPTSRRPCLIWRCRNRRPGEPSRSKPAVSWRGNFATGRGASGARRGVGRPQSGVSVDLHRLLPVPASILQLGPVHAAALAWLATHLGISDRLRQVTLRENATTGRRRPRGHAVIGCGFFTTGDTPHAAISRLAACWPALRLMLQPRPAD